MRARRWWAALAAAVVVSAHGHAALDGAEETDTGAGNLMAVLRESAQVHLEHEGLQPYGTVIVELPDGRELPVETSWFHYLGDMHIRLVFDSRTELQSASPGDLERLQLQPEQAVQVAVANLRRTYGEPDVQPWPGGLTRVLGRADDFNSSYFLDRAFWQRLQAAHPEGLVVAVPQRGGLFFAPAGDEDAVAMLRFSAIALYTSAPRQRVSSGLYLFRDGRWSVFQPPLGATAPQ